MPSGKMTVCDCCGAQISPDVPAYFIELECYRLLSERGQPVPRRGSTEYHTAMETLSADIRHSYFQNPRMYNRGHLWCPVCGDKLNCQEETADA